VLSAAEGKDSSLKEKTVGFLSRVNYMRGLGLLAEGGAAMMGVPTFGFANKAFSAIEDFLDGDGDEDDVKELKDSVKAAKEKTKGLIREKKKRTPPSEINKFRIEFGEILAELGKSIVVFVDNLDRCMPKQTIQTLEALRLFLFMPNTAFVIAADEEMVQHSVSSFFEDLDPRHVKDYLDKLIQVPIRVPRLGVGEVTGYLFLLFATAAKLAPDAVERLRAAFEANLRVAWKEDILSRAKAMEILQLPPDHEVAQTFDLAERLAPILVRTSAIRGNPRIVKRLLNVVRMRARVAARRGMPLDESVIAKLALFERCADEAAVADLYREIQRAPDGNPAFLQDIVSKDSDALAKVRPDSWARGGNVEFIQEWLALEPSLDGIDLRPAVYLARDATALAATRRGLSPAALAAIKALSKVPSLSSQAAKAAIANLASSETSLVMDHLVNEMRKRLPWEGRPDQMYGAVLLAKDAPATALALRGLAQSAYPKKSPGWLAVLMDDIPADNAGVTI
jgi:predicted KAP-like P-loop ATPase